MDEVKKYKYLEKFLSLDELKMLMIYCEIRHRSNKNFESNSPVISHNLDTYNYKDPLMEGLAFIKTPIIEKELNLDLHFGYSYWRMYTYGAQLHEHKDRPACEYSITMNIAESEPWPIYMDGEKIHIKPGDAVLYKGCEVWHKRDDFKGDYQAQVFMHWVDANGPHASHKWDNVSAPNPARFLGDDRVNI